MAFYLGVIFNSDRIDSFGKIRWKFILSGRIHPSKISVGKYNISDGINSVGNIPSEISIFL